MDRIYQRGLTTSSGGNISILDDAGSIWITPAAVDKGSLQPSDIMHIKADGTVTGTHKPSSEFPFHKAIYEQRRDIKAIIHAHPTTLVSFGIVHKIPNTNALCNSKIYCGSIGYATYEMPGSQELGESIAKEFSKGYNAILMENHGVVVGGTDLDDAFQRFEALEVAAQTIIYAHQLGIPFYLTDNQVTEFGNKIQKRFPELKSAVLTAEEQIKRAEIVKIIKRACNHGLMTGSSGSASVRLEGNDFLITPKGRSKWGLETDDLVSIIDGEREPAKFPSSFSELHQAIYKEHPMVKSIISAQPPCLMAFGITRTNFNVNAISESIMMLENVTSLAFETDINKELEQISQLCSSSPVIILQHHAVLVTGSSMAQAFDRLEVAEFSAKSIILSKSIGELQPISDNQIQDLRLTYFNRV